MTAISMILLLAFLEAVKGAVLPPFVDLGWQVCCHPDGTPADCVLQDLSLATDIELFKLNVRPFTNVGDVSFVNETMNTYTSGILSMGGKPWKSDNIYPRCEEFLPKSYRELGGCIRDGKCKRECSILEKYRRCAVKAGNKCACARDPEGDQCRQAGGRMEKVVRPEKRSMVGE